MEDDEGVCLRYTVLVRPPDPEDLPRFVVTVPELPGCVTSGETVEAALDAARDAILSYLDGQIKAGEELDRELQPYLIAYVEVEEPALIW